ncbi:MAG: hypothetical protein ACLFSM_04145 [Thermoplasmata archaeon]
MHLGRKKDLDPATRKLEREGLLSLKGQRKRRTAFGMMREFGRITYDFWSGVKYIVVLSAILWWIPLFGPILAGYVGGRRTGGPKKGLLASIVALGIIASIYYLFTEGFFYSIFNEVVEYPDKAVSLAMAHSLLGPYLQFVEQYWTVFFQRLWAGVPFSSNSYILTVIFAYIGGVISYEKRKEFTEGLRSLDRVKKDLSSIHRYAKNPIDESVAVSSARGERLEEMRPVRYIGKKRSREEPSNGARNDRNIRIVSERGARGEDRDNNLVAHNGKRKSIVRHHSSSNGDDWEFL